MEDLEAESYEKKRIGVGCIQEKQTVSNRP
jgi:hypothetical protein